jgi:hypothetical protein
MEEVMSQSTAKLSDTSSSEDAPRTGSRPVATFKQGGVEVSVWKNQTEKGDMFNTTISNSYKDDASGQWKETKSFSPTDLAVVAQLSSQAFQEISKLKTQGRGR